MRNELPSQSNPQSTSKSQPRSQPGGLRAVTADTFDALVLQSKGPSVVEFMSSGCSHCQTLEPILQQVVRKAKGQVAFFQVNIDSGEDLTTRFAIEGTPTLVMFRGGKELARSAGPSPTVANILKIVTEPFGGE